MAQPKQAWEVLAEEDRVIADNILQLASKGIVEWDILIWLADYRRKLAEGDDFDCDEAEADQIRATILEETAKELEKVGLEAANASITSENPSRSELTDEEGERELSEKLLPLLEDGIEEIDILRWLAYSRKEASMDKSRGQMCRVDVQFARVLFAGSDKLENALEEWAESDPFDTENGQDTSTAGRSAPEIIEFTPAAKILAKNPKLTERCSDIAQLIKQLNRTGRNEPCPCESGKKFKKCCGGI
ncbi:MAG: SEC-C domain-containing protein [Acidobacteriia bacterium]|nr:SEC-C domain-containing protein [Terriglobia bacterium]